MNRYLILATVLGAVLAACGGGKSTDPGVTPGLVTTASAGALSRAQEGQLEAYVRADVEKHGRAIGCAWLVSAFPDATTGKPLELTGTTGAFPGDWASGSVGSMGVKGDIQYATLYAKTPPAAKDAQLQRVGGDGSVCFVSGP